MFLIYFNLGFEHILDLNGYDHILYILALGTGYVLKDFKKIIILATAFTIGHSITLALAVLDFISVPIKLIEVLIPVTILISTIIVILNRASNNKRRLYLYFTALFFGLIHGMGFSTYLKALLTDSEKILKPLFAFNIGLEIGQIIILFIYLLLSSFLISILKIKRNYFILFTAGIIAISSIILIFQRI